MNQQASDFFPSFKPHPFIKGGQLQTIFGQLNKLKKRHRPNGSRREYITFSDGDKTSILIDEPTTPPLGSVVLFHGLGGSAHSTYCMRLSIKLVELGYRVIRYNHRGAGDGELALAKGIYHCGVKGDLLTAVGWVAASFPRELISLVGFSLSGTVLLNSLSECDAEMRNFGLIDKALAVCCPMDLEQSSLTLTKPSNYHIDRYYTRNLLAMAEERQRLHPSIEQPKLPTKMSLRLFDEFYTAPLGGFDNRNHYYESCSPGKKLGAIKIPTQILEAANDPIIPRASIPTSISNTKVKIRLERCGGHMGFIGAQRTSWQDKHWLDAYVCHWLQA